MPVGAAIIIAGGALGAAEVSSHATSKAVKAQTDATKQAIGNLQPFQNTGTQAFQTLGSLMGLGGGGGSAQTQSALPSTANTPWGGTVMDDGQQGSITDPNKQPNASVNGRGSLSGTSRSRSGRRTP